jgi:hypothetical protein
VRLAVGATTVLPARGRPPEAAARRAGLEDVEKVPTSMPSPMHAPLYASPSEQAHGSITGSRS